MKKFLKFIGWGIVVIMALGVISAIFGDKGAEPSKDAPKQEKAAEAKPEPKKETKNPITLENYEKIKVGDSITGEGGSTFEEVTALLGDKPTTKSESGSGDMKMVVVAWNAEGFSNLGDAISLVFTNDKVTNKTQVGLEE